MREGIKSVQYEEVEAQKVKYGKVGNKNAK